MADTPLEEFGKLGERFVEGLPGAAIVSVSLGALLLLTFDDEEFREAVPFVAVILAYLLNYIGHFVDNWLFDPVWSVPGNEKWRTALRSILPSEELVRARNNTAQRWGKPLRGIFAKAKQVTTGSEFWEKKIKWPLELSKAARSLLILDLVLLLWSIPLLAPFELALSAVALLSDWEKKRAVYNLALTFFAASLAAILLNNFVAIEPRLTNRGYPLMAPLLILLTWLYCRLRLMHIERMYRAASEIRCSEGDGFISAGSRVFAARNVLVNAMVEGEALARGEFWLASEALIHVKLFRGVMAPGPREAEKKLHIQCKIPVQKHFDSAFELPERPASLTDDQVDLVVTLVEVNPSVATSEAKERLNGVH